MQAVISGSPNNSANKDVWFTMQMVVWYIQSGYGMATIAFGPKSLFDFIMSALQRLMLSNGIIGLQEIDLCF